MITNKQKVIKVSLVTSSLVVIALLAYFIMPDSQEIDSSGYGKISRVIETRCPSLKSDVAFLMRDNIIDGWESAKLHDKCDEYVRQRIKLSLMNSL